MTTMIDEKLALQHKGWRNDPYGSTWRSHDEQ
jgi:hypothetical protein